DALAHLRRRRVRPALRAGHQAPRRRRAPRQVQAERHPPGPRRRHVTDLLAKTAELVDIASPSLAEGPFADLVEGWLREVPWLTVDRHGDNVVARTDLGREQRLVLAGHLDTVPANG